MERICKLSVLVVGLAVLAGCGGSSQSPSRAGSLTFKVKWPTKTRLIPYDSASIVAVVSDSKGHALGSQTLARPAEGVLTTSVSFTSLPAESVTLTASAYPTAQGTGVAQAVGTIPATIVSGQTAQVTVTMADTVTAIKIFNADGTPGGETLQTGQTDQLTWQTLDAAGDTVLTSAATIQWYMTGGEAYGSVSSTGLVTMLATGKYQEDFAVFVKETESGVTAESVFYYTPPKYNTPGFALTDQTGTHLYTLDNGGVHVYTIAPGGQLSLFQEVADSNISSQQIDNIGGRITPDGKHLVIYSGYSTVDSFNIQSDGTLTTVSSQPSPTNALTLGMDPTGTYFYTSGAGSSGGQMNIYTLTSSGVLTISDMITSFTPGIPRYAVNDPGTPYMFASASNAQSELQFLTMTVGSGGALTVTNDMPTFSVIGPPLVFTPNGKILYSLISEVRTIGISSTGIPTDYGYNGSLGFNDEDLCQGAVNPAGTILYLRGYAGSEGGGSDAEYILPCTIGINGALTPLAKTGTGLPEESTGSVVISPNGQFLYTTNGNDNSISQFSVNADGSLTALSPAKVTG